MKTYNLTYYPWITQHKPPQVIRQSIGIFAAELQQELRRSLNDQVTVEVLEPLDVPQQIESIVKGRSQVALMNPLGFIFAKNRDTNNIINASVVALRLIDGKIGDTYFAQIYGHVDSGFQQLKDLKKRAMGYGTSHSTSNFIIPAFDLRKANLHPFTAFKRVEFVGGHDLAAKAVYEKRIDAGAGHDGVIIDLANQPDYKDAAEKLKMIHRSSPIPSDPIAVNVDDQNEYRCIQNALVEISKRSPASEAIKEFWGNAQGLRSTSFEAYQYLNDAVHEMGLTENDLFG